MIHTVIFVMLIGQIRSYIESRLEIVYDTWVLKGTEIYVNFWSYFNKYKNRGLIYHGWDTVRYTTPDFHGCTYSIEREWPTLSDLLVREVEGVGGVRVQD